MHTFKVAAAFAALAVAATGMGAGEAAGGHRKHAKKPAMMKVAMAGNAKKKPGPGACGTYFYFKGGKCVDKR